MRYRKLDSAGDFVLGSGSDFHINSPEAVGQAVLTRLRLLVGEWFANISDGTPWNTKALVNNFQVDDYDYDIKRRILATPGVVELVSYSSVINSNTRDLETTFTNNTLYGITSATGTL